MSKPSWSGPQEKGDVGEDVFAEMANEGQWTSGQKSHVRFARCSVTILSTRKEGTLHKLVCKERSNEDVTA